MSRMSHRYRLTDRHELTIMVALYTQANDLLDARIPSDAYESKMRRIYLARNTVDAYETIAKQRGNGNAVASVIAGWRVRIVELEALKNAQAPTQLRLSRRPVLRRERAPV